MFDRNFDDIADKFTNNIYGTLKGDIRQAILWQEIEKLLAYFPNKTLSILDAGGGSGIMACRLAKLGHQVTLCDISEQMLQQAKQRAKKEDVEANLTFIHASVQEIKSQKLPPFDAILFHAVLEWVTEPFAILEQLTHCLANNGLFSLMFFNKTSLLFRNIHLGNWQFVTKGMPKKKRRTLTPNHPLPPEQVYAWLTELDLTILGKTGVRVFSDYLKEPVRDYATLLALETQYCRQEPFISLGRYIHILAQYHNRQGI